MAMKAIPQQEFQKCFHRWQNHWAKCIAAQGEHFEGILAIKEYQKRNSHTSYIALS